jgi:hypothetical protein
MRAQLTLFLCAKKLFLKVGRGNGCLRWLVMLYWRGSGLNEGGLACRFVTLQYHIAPPGHILSK